jgi:hypothetical protein
MSHQVAPKNSAALFSSGYRLTRDLHCEAFSCEQGVGAGCKTCRLQATRTDEAWAHLGGPRSWGNVGKFHRLPWFTNMNGDIWIQLIDDCSELIMVYQYFEDSFV